MASKQYRRMHDSSRPIAARPAAQQPTLAAPRPFAAPASPMPTAPAPQLHAAPAGALDYTIGALTLRPGDQRQLMQPKLVVTGAGDQYEQEADRVASEVVRRISAPPRHDQAMQRKSAGDGGTVTPDVEAAIQQARGGGAALAEDVRAPLEQTFGHSLADVRIHTNAEADALNRSLSARAFTTGRHIFFRRGEYSPDSHSGRELLGHELTHVVQQRRGMVRANRQMLGVGLNDAEEFESEADRIGARSAVSPSLAQAGVVGDRIARREVGPANPSAPVIQPAYIARRPLGGTPMTEWLIGDKQHPNFHGVFHEHIIFEDGQKPSDLGFLGPQGVGPDQPELLALYRKKSPSFSDQIMRAAAGRHMAPGAYTLAGNNCQKWVHTVLEEYHRLSGLRSKTKKGGKKDQSPALPMTGSPAMKRLMALENEKWSDNL